MNIKIVLGLVWAILIIAFMTLAIVAVATDHIVYMKLAMVLGGFLFYSMLMMSINKDEYDDSGNSFPLIAYAEKTWDNWILNWIGAVLLLIAGQQMFGIINMMEQTDLKWTDGYYVGSGFIVNLVVDRMKAKRKPK